MSFEQYGIYSSKVDSSLKDKNMIDEKTTRVTFDPSCNSLSPPQDTNEMKTPYKITKKKSKISLAFEKLDQGNNINNNINTNRNSGLTETKCSSVITSSNFSCGDNTNTNNINNNKKNTLTNCKCVVNISLMIGNKLKTINLNITNNTKLNTVIEKGLITFNDEFSKEKALIRLRDDNRNYYVLKPAKKSGKPKLDMPPFLNSLTIKETGTENFALCWKENPDDFVQMFECIKRKQICGCCIQ